MIGGRTPVRRSQRPAPRRLDWLLCALIALLAAVPAASAQDSGLALPIVAPVKVLPSSPPAPAVTMETMAAEENRPQPTLPGGKLPQYQLEDSSRFHSGTGEEARVRFILALRQHPVIVEAEITIDGRPFPMAREQRIEQVLGALEQPADSNAADSDAESLRRYFAASTQPATADEIRWLLTQWRDGPVLLPLRDNFQRFRAGERPVFDVLDRNRDGRIAADELEEAAQSMTECDLNRDGIVDYAEIARVARDPRLQAAAQHGPGKLIFAVPDETSASSTYRRLAAGYAAPVEAGSGGPALVPRFDGNGDGRFDADELRALQSGQPDVRLVVSFDSGDAAQSTIRVTELNAPASDAILPEGAAETTISLPLGGDAVVFSALQNAASDQVSFGAVLDGYPLLPEIDPNDDGRLTIREMRELVGTLRRLDRNTDGRITAAEARPPVRVCIGLGPVVHGELAGIRSVDRKPSEPALEGPEWFVRMDRNRDGDLTRAEFPGTDEQFATLDADSDELINAEEALEFDRKAREPADGTTSAEPSAPDTENGIAP